jgi:colanic acid/amylovoran biosynthesis glycosyltransferase
MQASTRGRIAVIVSRFPTLTQTYVYDEILELRRRGLDVQVFALIRERESRMHAAAKELDQVIQTPRLLSRDGVGAQLYWLRRRPSAYFRLMAAAVANNPRPGVLARTIFAVVKGAVIARACVRSGVQHVHAHFATYPTGAAVAVKALAGVPFSFTAHAHDIQIRQLGLSWKCSQASFVVTISEFNREFMIAAVGDTLGRKIEVIRCGVDVEDFRTRPSTRSDPFTIICVAALQERKGHQFLLEACRAIRYQVPGLRCVLVGDGPTKRALEALIRNLDLAETVSMLGWRPHHETLDLVRGADVMVLPSTRIANGSMEGIPVALIEGMAAGLPVIGTRLSGIPELIDDGTTGLLVAERDAMALADAIVRLAGDAALRKRLGAAARKRVQEEYSRRTNVGHLVQLIGDSISGGVNQEYDPSHGS